MPLSRTHKSELTLPVCLNPDGAVPRARVQNVAERHCFLQAGPSPTVAPDFDGALLAPAFVGGFTADQLLSDYFPGTVAPGASAYVWVQSDYGFEVSIAHA